MKKGKIILTVILGCMVIFICIAFIKRMEGKPVQPGIASVDGGVQKENDEQKKWEEKEKKREELEPYCNKEGEVMPYAGNIKSIGEKFITRGFTEDIPMEYSVNQFYITKEAVDTDAYYNDYWNVQFDANGNIIDDYNFIVVNATIKNVSGKVTPFDISCFRINYLSDNIDDVEFSELMGYKTRLDTESDKSYYQMEFQPEEEVTVNLVYLVPETYMQGRKIYVKISPGGQSQGYSRYVLLQ